MKFIKNNIEIVLITLTGFVLRILAIFMDPFLHPWDERYHALVARNIMDHPLMPTLRPSPLFGNADPFSWCCNYIWLHKQPLFMWQMALSMKIFGVSEYSMRLPSAVMGTLMIIMLHRIVMLIFKNKSVALFSALFLTFSNFYLQLISGVRGMDHNDIAHSFYILSSIWAFAEYLRNPKWYWVMLIGVFSGGAVLNKWLTGLFVFLIWGLYLLFELIRTKKGLKRFLPFFVSVLISFTVFLPWQIYILIRYPELAIHEYKFNSRHVTEVIEGHKGSVFYYFCNLYDIVGNYIYWLILPGLFLILRKKKFNDVHWALILATLFVVVFYSFLVKTKIQAYLLFIVPIFLICIAFCIEYLFKILPKFFVLRTTIVIVIIFCLLRPIEIRDYLSEKNQDRNHHIENTKVFKRVCKTLPENVKIVMNLSVPDDVEFMFYNPGVLGYCWSLSERDMKLLEARKIPVGFFKPHGEYGFAPYVRDYPYLYVIDEQLDAY
jgi:4-amino-4-deoxy-L-arabinose transferase